jgi:predicted transcriptional regulator
MADAQTLTLSPDDRPVLQALRRTKGRATVGDVSARTGLGQSEAEAALRRLLEQRRGHLEVGERGDLVYAFEPGLLER